MLCKARPTVALPQCLSLTGSEAFPMKPSSFTTTVSCACAAWCTSSPVDLYARMRSTTSSKTGTDVHGRVTGVQRLLYR